MIFYIIIFELTFYHSHVLLHSKSLFKYHKVTLFFSNILPMHTSSYKAHHNWKAPIAAATALGHPVDFLLHCVLAVSLGPVLVRSHLSTAWVWYLVITLHELNDHSGYHFPWMRSSQVGVSNVMCCFIIILYSGP